MGHLTLPSALGPPLRQHLLPCHGHPSTAAARPGPVLLSPHPPFCTPPCPLRTPSLHNSTAHAFSFHLSTAHLPAVRGTLPTGCSDQAARCSNWANKGQCAAGWVYRNQPVGTVVCRESCGACGDQGGAEETASPPPASSPSPPPTDNGDGEEVSPLHPRAVSEHVFARRKTKPPYVVPCNCKPVLRLW